MKLSYLFFGLFLLLIIPSTVVGKGGVKRWSEVTDDYIIVDDKLFNYIKSFTKNKGKRHFLFTVAMVESRLNPYSQKGSCGEIGMMQILPTTGKFLEKLKKKKIDVSTVRDNIYAALFYLDFILDEINDHCPGNLSLNSKVRMVSAAYNGGTGHLSKGCSIESYNASARGYSEKFVNYWNRSYISRSSYEKQYK